eukprot:2548192-Amphidinium_carterae.1
MKNQKWASPCVLLISIGGRLSLIEPIQGASTDQAAEVLLVGCHLPTVFGNMYILPRDSSALQFRCTWLPQPPFRSRVMKDQVNAGAHAARAQATFERWWGQCSLFSIPPSMPNVAERVTCKTCKSTPSYMRAIAFSAAHSGTRLDRGPI